MRIKRLIIKNIASIESGDIDFENGLKDPFTGESASLFLISGDTGAGKSTVLDCISLTLYGTTPRVIGVNGTRSNKYIVGDKAISVSDVRQYTRLGIGPKDECYARLEFIGNDGVEYISTFYLGVTTHGNLSKARWTLDIAHETTLEQEKNVAPRILQAIGLTYEQFSRMAMLAQGQFASFLTGGKEERERILEQLTSTQRFSDYGKVISGIFKKKKQAKEILETRLASESSHILPSEEEQRLKNKIENDGKNLKSMRDQLDLINKILDFEKIIEDCTESIRKADEELTNIKDRQNSDEYKRIADILRIWDQTSKLRALTSEKISNEAQIQSMVVKLESLLGIETRVNAGEVGNNSENSYGDRSFNVITSANEKISCYFRKLNSLTEDLTKIVGEKGIASLRNKAKVLDDKIKDIENLSDLIVSLKSEREALKRSIQEEDDLYSGIREIEGLKESSQKTLDEYKKLSEDAERRYMTMHLSLSENFHSLRKRLREEEASDCPLCGRHMDNPSKWDIDDATFSQILSPLEKEKMTADVRYTKAAADHNLLIERLNKAKGELKALSLNNHRAQERLKSNEHLCLDRLNTFGISDLNIDIDVLKVLKDQYLVEVRTIELHIENADDIQKSISALRKKDELYVTKLRSETAILDNLLEESKRISKEQITALDSAGLTLDSLNEIMAAEKEIPEFRKIKEKLDSRHASLTSLKDAEKLKLNEAKNRLTELAPSHCMVETCKTDSEHRPVAKSQMIEKKNILTTQIDALLKEYGSDTASLEQNEVNKKRYGILIKEVETQREEYLRWNKLNNYLGGTKFRTLVQSYILRPLLANANRYLERITDHYTLTCSDENEQLAILVLDRYNKNQMRSATILSGGERFMISLALSLALSSLNKPDMNVDILFIDEGFGTLDASNLSAVMDTLRRLPDIAGQNGRRVGVISHREELADEIGVKIKIERCGEGRSRIKIENQ